MFENLNFELGKSYRLKYRRTTVDFINETDNFYEILVYKNGVKPSKGPWIIHKDLAGSMRAYSGFPTDYTGFSITCIETGEVIFGEDKKTNIKTKK